MLFCRYATALLRDSHNRRAEKLGQKGNDFANVYSFDSDTGRLFITSTEYGYDVKSMTFSFRNGGSALSGLSFTAVEGGYMLQSVPEPAEWAAVFGVAALALALRRKTKNLRR